MAAKTVGLDFLGQKISFKTESDPDLIPEVMELVNIKVKDARSRSPNAAPHQIALLALFDLAEDYARARKKILKNRADLDHKTEELLNLIETELA